ncbi:MAG: apiosidase-like domain-containing protein [Armatimonadota bacterium]
MIRWFHGVLPALLGGALLLAVAASASAGQPTVSFTCSTDSVEVHDFIEITLRLAQAPAGNPFTDASLDGLFQLRGGNPIRVEGFCDDLDGRVFRIRFMPNREGEYSYSVTFRQGKTEHVHTGTFHAVSGKRKGPLRVDREHPWHFIWEGNQEHYFWNGTTTYWLMGWDERGIREAIERLHRLKVNRIRVAVSGRVKDARGWFENVYPTTRFTFLLNPWVAKRPESVEDPGFDVTRFNVAYWRKYEELVRFAQKRNIIVSVVFYVDGMRPGVDPFGKSGMGGPDEQRYYRYAIARLAAYSNVTWDISNEYHFFRDDAWAKKMGTLVKQYDPYDHLTSVHGREFFNFRMSPWADFAMYQQWDEHGGYDFMLRNRLEQEKQGRPIPQINEEYGYEDSYPQWGEYRKAPARSADNRRRLAWQITMAGAYQTTGERADSGTGWGPDTGGGWVNGRGDDSMVMLKGYGHLVSFFTGFHWWETEPRGDLVTGNALCLAKPGELYVVYLPAGGQAKLKLEPGKYKVNWYNPRTGKFTGKLTVEGPEWTSPKAQDQEDWAILLKRQ